MRKTTMTPKRAKAITLEVWEYLAAHPEVQFKQGLPKRLFAKIKDLNQACPLCELYNGPGPGCPGCPLGNCNYPSPFGKWCSPEVQDKDREAAAQEIVEKIRAWEPGKKPRSAKGRQGGKA